MGQLMWVRMLPGDSTHDAKNGGVSTAEPENRGPKGQFQRV
jgi:hypothetical protein